MLLQKRANGDYMMMMDGLSLPWGDPDAYFQYFHSAGSAYAAAVKFKNEWLDQLLEEGRRITDRARRKEIYGEVGRSFVKGYVRLPGSLGTWTAAFMERVWIEK